MTHQARLSPYSHALVSHVIPAAWDTEEFIADQHELGRTHITAVRRPRTASTPAHWIITARQAGSAHRAHS